MHVIDVPPIEPDIRTVYEPINVQPVSDSKKNACSAYDSSISWIEKAYQEFSVCYTAESSQDEVEFVAYWVAFAIDIQRVKYQVREFRRFGTGSPFHINIMLLPEPDSNADTGTTRFMCCYNKDGERSSSGQFAWIPYLSPSHSDWERSPTFGRLRLSTENFHIKNLMHEMTHAGQLTFCDHRCKNLKGISDWIYEGLAEYEGLVHIDDNGKLERLAIYVTDRKLISLGIPLKDTEPEIIVADVYSGGNLFMQYLADRFGESIHLRLANPNNTFAEALQAEFESKNVSLLQVFGDMQKWIEDITRLPETFSLFGEREYTFTLNNTNELDPYYEINGTTWRLYPPHVNNPLRSEHCTEKYWMGIRGSSTTCGSGGRESIAYSIIRVIERN